VLCSLEMSHSQIYDKFLSMDFSGNILDFKANNLSDNEQYEANSIMEGISSAPLWIDETSCMTITQLRSKARRWKTKFNIQMLVVDYIQLLSAGQGYGKREEQVAEISRTLKHIAKELKIPVIALSQLNRQVESRPDRKPVLSDLRESGAIEQDADIVMLLNRPEKYMAEFPDGNSTKNVTEVIIAKHRNGETGEIQLRCELSKSKYIDITAEDNPPF
jgi:replicative DNA helicase